MLYICKVTDKMKYHRYIQAYTGHAVLYFSLCKTKNSFLMTIKRRNTFLCLRAEEFSTNKYFGMYAMHIKKPTWVQICTLTHIYMKGYCDRVISKLPSLKDSQGFYRYIYLIAYFSVNVPLLVTTNFL